MNDESSTSPPRPAAIDGGLDACGFCGRSVSPRALFCHHCGSLQPPRDLDDFTRLGMARRFDIDQAELDRQTMGFLRVLAPERFETRGPRERQLAEKHRAALTAARQKLRDPLTRAQVLLALNGHAPVPAMTPDPSAAAIHDAANVAEIDQLTAAMTRSQETLIQALSGAFRVGDVTAAAVATDQLRSLAEAMDVARQRRATLTNGNFPTPNSQEGLDSDPAPP